MSNGFGRRSAIWFYLATTFISAFLLFQVQPIISKAILPWFGGSPAVWTTAMLFFQTLLFAGYAYAHFTQRLRPAVQAALHVALLAIAVAIYPILPGPNWKPIDGSNPAGRILLLLTVCVGLPYFVLSATGPLVQTWFSRDYPDRSPYRLYSLSNVGSLSALLTYPFLIEPRLVISSQGHAWEIGFFVFALGCGFLAVRAWLIRRPARQFSAARPFESARLVQAEVGGLVVAAAVANSAAINPYQVALSGGAILQTSPPTTTRAKAESTTIEKSDSATDADDAAPGWGRRLLWLVLPAFASLAFLATTNHVCQDVAVIPFLWIAPLSLYLVSFIICFDHERWYIPRLYAAMTLLVFLAGGLWATRAAWTPYFNMDAAHFEKIQIEVALSFAGMFLICMLCHGELVRLRPHPRYLTMFYLLIAAGGAVGGLFVSLLAPVIFQTGYTEWIIALLGGCALAVAIILGTEKNGFVRRYPWLFVPGFIIVGVALYHAAVSSVPVNSRMIAARRNFYGVVSVVATSLEVKKGQREPILQMVNGQTWHGMQFQDEPLRPLPTTYYGHESGVGRAIDWFQKRNTADHGVRIGAVGLGVGTLAAYARANDQFVFYEINPQVRQLAEKYFTFLRDADEMLKHGSGQLDIVMGDGRLSLERELSTLPPRRFQVLVIDAFSGDAIPTHLITREAGDIYSRQLDSQGVLAFHVSNHYLDLEPVVRGLADYLNFTMLKIESRQDNSVGTYQADWMLLTNKSNTQFLAATSKYAEKPPANPKSLLWTDEYSDLFEILK